MRLRLLSRFFAASLAGTYGGLHMADVGENESPAGHTPLRRQLIYVDNKTAPQRYRSGFRYPRWDARLHKGDKVQLWSTSHKRWLHIEATDATKRNFRTLGLVNEQHLAATFAIDRASVRSPVVSVWCMGHGSYLSVRRADGAVGCFSDRPTPFNYVRIDGQKWADASRGSLQDPVSGGFLQAIPSAGGGAVNSQGEEASGWNLFRFYLVAGFEAVFPLLRGVNLGNWFVLERWMSEALFADEDGRLLTGNCEALDERALMARLTPQTRRERMEKHWSTWITERDIRWLAKSGINAVRVPFGYWMTHPDPPFFDGQFVYLVRLFEWCERFSVSIILDFHGLKGSQNGAASSGNCGACSRPNCGPTLQNFLAPEERAVNLAVIGNLSAYFSTSPAFLGFSLANEVGQSCDRSALMSYYQRAYDIIRSHSPDVLVIMGDIFHPSSYPFQEEDGLVQDVHTYFSVISTGASGDHRANLATATESLTQQERWPVLVGEWSLDHHGFAGLQGLGLAEQEKWLRDFAKVQLQAYEQRTLGWIYWNYKVDDNKSTWNYLAMCKRGLLPGCTDGFDYSSGDWWNNPPSEFAYFDRDAHKGLAGTVTVGPYVVGGAGSNSCPPASVSVSEAECRQMPTEFGGILHSPFRVRYSSDPRGCFKFQGSFYYNIHPSGAGRIGRLPLCRLECSAERASFAGGGACLDSGNRAGDVGSAGREPNCTRQCYIEYDIGETGSRDCPHGSVVLSEAECHGALGLFGAATGPFREFNADDPQGCFRFEKGLYFNSHPVGSARAHRTPICRRKAVVVARTTEVPRVHHRPPDGTAWARGESGTNHCPPISMPLTEEECRMMPDEFSGKLNSPFVEDLADDPKGCFSFEQGFYYNKHPDGAPREHRTPFCKRVIDPLADPSQKLRMPSTTMTTTTAPETTMDFGALAIARAAAAVAKAAAESLRVGSTTTSKSTADAEAHIVSTALPSVAANVTAPGPVQEGSRYVTGDLGTNGCPPYSAVMEEAECWEMPKELGTAGTPASITVERVQEDPRGCFQFREGFYYNEHPHGAPRLGRRPLCKRTAAPRWISSAARLLQSQEAVNADPHSGRGPTLLAGLVAGEPGTNGCPAGTVTLTELECKAAHKGEESTSELHDPFVERLADDPKGCFKFRNAFYYNEHPQGSPRPERTPYCKPLQMAIFA